MKELKSYSWQKVSNDSKQRETGIYIGLINW